jgi:hypothetical protein
MMLVFQHNKMQEFEEFSSPFPSLQVIQSLELEQVLQSSWQGRHEIALSEF